MKVVIAGSRSITDYALVERAVEESGFDVTVVLSGTANGVDKLGERWAQEHDIPTERFPAEWDKYGRSAGPIRNKQMVEYADGLIAVWDGESRGTANIMNLATDAGLPIHVSRPPAP